MEDTRLRYRESVELRLAFRGDNLGLQRISRDRGSVFEAMVEVGCATGLAGREGRRGPTKGPLWGGVERGVLTVLAGAPRICSGSFCHVFRARAKMGLAVLA